MREYLFRGKRVDSGEWVYGYLSKHRNVFNRVYTKITPYDPIERDAYVEDGAAVIPETVGQFTGIIDKNGNKIFEGDIIKFVRAAVVKWHSFVGGFVLYESARRGLKWRLLWGRWRLIGEWTGFADYEVIGNEHDNPELLEDKQ